MRSATAVLLLAVALLDRPARRSLDQVERAVRSDRGAVDGVVQLGACAANRLRHPRRVRCLPLERRADELERVRDRLVHELDRLEQLVGEAVLDRFGPAQHLVLAQRVLDDEADGRLRVDEPRDELRPAPSGDDPQEALRQREVTDRGCDRARVAVKRDLDAAAEARAVDRGDRRERERADAAEEVVPRAAALDRLLARGDLRELVDVRARAEDEGLSGQHHRDPAAGLELADNAGGGLESAAAEDRRFRPVLAVVHRHERERACLGLDAVQEEGRVRHACSPTPARPPSPCRRRARSARSGRRAPSFRRRAEPSGAPPWRPADGRRRSRRRRG